jgi:hypothetical protein
MSNDTETYGVDPAENLAPISRAKGHYVYTGYFDEDYTVRNPQPYDILVAQNVFAHNYDPMAFLITAKRVMDDNSLLFIQTSQADMIVNNEFDTIYHEHISFFNVQSMDKLCKRAGLFLVGVEWMPIHGTSYIFEICKEPTNITNTQEILFEESIQGLYDMDTYYKYRLSCLKYRNDFNNKILEYKLNDKSIIAFGSTAKSMTVLNFCNLNN